MGVDSYMYRCPVCGRVGRFRDFVDGKHCGVEVAFGESLPKSVHHRDLIEHSMDILRALHQEARNKHADHTTERKPEA
jgi:hypothetical protein